MKKILIATLITIIATANAHASIYGLNNPPLIYTAPDTQSTVTALVCEDFLNVYDGNTGIEYQQNNCSTSPTYTQIWPLNISSIVGLTSALAGKYNVPTGTTSQYVRGDGSLATLPSSGSKTFNYPSRTINACYQISSTQDSDFHYKVDVSSSLSLTSGATGTVTITSYSNSGCTSGAQVITDGTSGQSGSLVVGLGINQIQSVSLDGTAPAGKWLKITTANTSGTPTFVIRSVQSEILN